MWLTVELVVAQAGAGDDRVLVRARGDCIVIGVVDGAGGTGRGAAAAEAVLALLAREDDVAPVAFLAACDSALAGSGGETTAVIVRVDARGLIGASVGDSGAWLVGGDDAHEDLTAQQQRKPLIGSGRAQPIAFAGALTTQTLLVATDGLFKYAAPVRLRSLAREAELTRVPERLVDAVRLRSGGLQDDVGIVVCRRG